MWPEWASLLTMDRLRAGRIECERGDGRDDDDQGTAVPGQLEAGKGQDVRSLALRRASLSSPRAFSSSLRHNY